MAAHWTTVSESGAGRLVLVGGDAGVGKTSLTRTFAAVTDADALWGACDALRTPRALGPLVDVADAIGGTLAEVIGREAAPGDVAAALLAHLREQGPALLILEDLHWADEATLDVLRLLGRRIGTIPALVLVTYRADELHATHPLRIALGELPPGSAHRLALKPLTEASVAELAAEAGISVDPLSLHRRTGGNPFFVTEVLAAGGVGGGLPETLRDAVLARASRLDPPARRLLDAVAIEPGGAELWLLRELADEADDALDDGIACGMLLAERETVTFRHEIARRAIADALAPHRRATLHARALATLTEAVDRRPDLARMAHHAEAAGDEQAVLRWAPAAGARAAGVGSHREAAAHFERAVSAADGLPPQERAELLERQSFELYLTDRMGEAIAAHTVALEARRDAGDRRGEGDAHRWLSRLHWYSGDNRSAETQGALAIDVLEGLGPSRELAMAYSNLSQLRMLAEDNDGAVIWGERALALAEQFDEPEIVAHALNNIGSAGRRRNEPGSHEKLAESLAISLQHGFDDHAARAYTNIAVFAVEQHEVHTASRLLDEGIAYATDRDLEIFRLYMIGYRARLALDRGDWATADADAQTVADHPATAPCGRHNPMVVHARLLACRGEGDPWPTLDEALELARPTGEPQRVVPAVAARAEARWLSSETGDTDAETAEPLAAALARKDPWNGGELAIWRHRHGLDVPDLAPGAVAEPYALELAGDPLAAAAAWDALGCPFEAALARAQSDDEDARRAALDAFEELGARAAAARVARSLRADGVRGVVVRSGPRAATRENPAGLTARELEVLALVAEGLRNSDIAGRLFLSERTVGHHVSAILRKLGVRSRAQAATEAARLGLA
ncbi:ATP-binding protein [Baekduia sp. Peel2402]|uniref:ATP-binding protein n=1 Tax=Baekduia sp. Peel2402 TaxID=3458296 RepID=UPI00403EF609